MINEHILVYHLLLLFTISFVNNIHKSSNDDENGDVYILHVIFDNMVIFAYF